MSDKTLRKGYTTGSCATAAAVAAITKILCGTTAHSINIYLPDNSQLNIPVYKDSTGIYVIKDGGDDADATHGMKIYADVIINQSGNIEITGGEGIGIVTKKGLQVPVGQHAINPVPIKMIKKNVRRIIGDNKGAVVTIFAPEGLEIAKKTFNENLGIIGGISIIGTTGIVEPMSMDALIASIKCEIDVCVAEGAKKLCLVPGKTGLKAYKKTNTKAKTVMMSNFAGNALTHTYLSGIQEIILAGHPSKLGKIAFGHFNTHSKKSPQIQDNISQLYELKKGYNTVEELIGDIENLDLLAQLIKKRILSIWNFNKVSITLFNMKGEIKGES